MSDDEYTPTTGEVRYAYALHESDCAMEVWALTSGDPMPEPMGVQQARFDRWLVAHDAEVARAAAEKAWDEGYRTGEGNALASIRAGARIVSDNPYRDVI